MRSLLTLKEVIAQKIKSEGPINFEDFMDICLYYPGLGYYTRNSTNIGRAGDFYTSPHLHPIFGAMLGRQMEEMWEIMGMPAIFNIVEMGAGMGYVAKDMLDYLEARGGGQEAKSGDKTKNIFESLRYTIIELNPSVKAGQEELLAGFRDKVRWVSDLNEFEPVAGCFISNELPDAFPVRLIEMHDELKEIYVDIGANGFAEVRMPCSGEVKDYLSLFNIELASGYRTEVNLKSREWIGAVSAKLKEGFVLTIDYGYPAQDYYSPERSRGTLLCYHSHQINEDPYQNIGEQDITAHVNFSSLKKWGEDAGLKTLGFCPQGTYLVSLGIDEIIKELYGNSPDAFETAKIKGLLLPEGMGESHKVMIQHKGSSNPILRGFALRNQVRIL